MKNPLPKFVLVCILMLAGALPALAWDDSGHRLVAYIAWRQMSPAARERAVQLLLNAPEDSQLNALYPAPPEVCEAVGRTVLFAAIPVVSTETSDLPTQGINYQSLPPADRKQMVDHFSEYLKARPQLDMPRKGEELSPDWNVLDVATMAAAPRLSVLGTFLHQALVELDALGSSRASSDLLAVLREIRLPTAENALGQVTATIDAAEFVRLAGPVLIGREANSSHARMPLPWPQVSEALGPRVADAGLA
jgi:hypothetical protein